MTTHPLLLITVLVAASTSPLAGQSVRVMTWNIRYDNPGDGVDRWRNRKDWVAEIIQREELDFAGFQEVLASQFDDLHERLPEMGSYGAGRNDGKRQGEMTPIFYRKERFERLDEGTFWLSPTPKEVGSKGWDAALPRIASWLQLQDKKSKQTIVVLNTHFDHQGKEARRESAELIVKRIRQQFADQPVVLLGDLTAPPNRQRMKL